MGRSIRKILWDNFYIRNLILVSLFILAIIFGTLKWLDSYTHHNEALIVPDVRGLAVEEGSEFIQKKRLRVEVIDSVYAKDKAPGTIIDQIPAGESKVKENRIVFLIVNAKNVQLVTVPDVSDNSQRQAEASLQALGFKIGSIQIVQSEWKGLVIDLSANGEVIPPGTTLPIGTTITLRVGGDVDIDSLKEDSTIKPIEVPKNEESWF